METLELQQPSMNVGLTKACLFSCQFYYAYENRKYYAHQQEKNVLHKYIYHIIKAFERNPEGPCPVGIDTNSEYPKEGRKINF